MEVTVEISAEVNATAKTAAEVTGMSVKKEINQVHWHWEHKSRKCIKESQSHYPKVVKETSTEGGRQVEIKVKLLKILILVSEEGYHSLLIAIHFFLKMPFTYSFISMCEQVHCRF